MKKLLFLFVVILAVSCSSVTEKFSKNVELYEKTDSFVQSLSTTYESYGMLGGIDRSESTSDGLYKITPIGRLINVKFQTYASSSDYETLKEDLQDHYKGNSSVNDVYICGGGTVMIDCRH